MIRTRLDTDDRAFPTYTFDATGYFAELSSSTLPNVVAEVVADAGGDYLADNVTYAFEESDPRIAERLEYCRDAMERARQRGSSDYPGFEAHIHLGDLADWLSRERPLAYERNREALLAAITDAAYREPWPATD